MNFFKRLLSRAQLLLASVYIYPLKTVTALMNVPRYIVDWNRFRRASSQRICFYPALLDRNADSGLLGEYFWQDLFVAREVIARNPRRHIDVGSRIDGFVAHLACVRQVEVLDIRPLESVIPNVAFQRADITRLPEVMMGSSDLVTCLHTIEHVGLGRYGDPINPNGWRDAISGLAKLLSSGGDLWLSVPVGEERVEFNAHRVFFPTSIAIEAHAHELSLSDFFVLVGTEFESRPVFPISELDENLGPYQLGVFRFHKG